MMTNNGLKIMKERDDDIRIDLSLIYKGIEELKKQGGSPKFIIIPYPKSGRLYLGDKEFIITGPHVCNFLGLEVYVDNKVPKDRIYLLEEFEKKDFTEDQRLFNKLQKTRKMWRKLLFMK